MKTLQAHLFSKAVVQDASATTFWKDWCLKKINMKCYWAMTVPPESVFYSLRSCSVHYRNKKTGLGKVWNLGAFLKSRYHSLNSEYTGPFAPYFYVWCSPNCLTYTLVNIWWTYKTKRKWCYKTNVSWNTGQVKILISFIYKSIKCKSCREL